ncbi:HAMP domain-containing sensor histidine kinase [Catellatospora sp. NPDC049111]|uniref:sensor histidine kinase n=1 Tax=Catellatospora sp. NPDC049111 TaxID=3155271 RepID=UPI003406A32F
MEVAYRELTLGIAALFNDPVTGRGGLPALDRLLHLGQYALGVPGMALSELHLTGGAGRVIAATGTADWALGRPVQPEVVTAVLRPGPTTYRVELGAVDDEASDQMSSLGSRWILLHRIDLVGRPPALLGAFMPDDRPADADQLAVMALLGATVGRLYSERAGLPVQSAGDDLADRELFIAVTSHELRTPVTVIKGYADTLRDHWSQLDDKARREAARVIGQRSDELARLVDRLLAASTDTAVGTLSPGPFDLVEALRHAATNLPADLRRRFRLELPERLPLAYGDRATIPNVLTELATNADKYSAREETVVLSAGNDRRTVYFQILDRGIGIAPGQAHQVFERFWQADSGDGRRYGGAGLGLYLVRKTIERQNGWVSLRPRDGGGTVAEVRLPRGDVKRDANASGEA